MARGPAYPYVDLPKAIELVQKMYDFAKRSAVPATAVAKDAWGYSAKSSSGQKILAALKYYSLVDDVKGGSSKQVKISPIAHRILLDTKESEKRKQALQEAALSPKAYKYCWDEWGAELPSDSAMRSHLIFEREFIETTVDSFIKDYKSTIEYAGLLSDKGSELPEGEDDGSEESNDSIRVGDYVQWESQGAWQFESPRKVTGFSQDGVYAFVEDSDTGILVDELEKSDSPPAKPETPAPLKPRNEVKPGMQQATFPLSEGDVVLQWPKSLSQDSYEDLKVWVELMLKRAERSVAKPSSDNDQDDT